jgi:hypothetical protein
MRIASVGHVVFAVILIVLGVQGLSTREFTAVWEPVAKTLPGREVLIYLCPFVSLASGVGLLWGRTSAVAARVLLVALALWVLLLRLPPILRAPATFPPWDGAAETVAMLAGAWALHASLANGPVAGERGVRIVRVLYGLSMVPFGIAHIHYVKETAAMVPGWLPAHIVWAYATGGAFLAAGVAVLSGVWARLGAALSALQIGLFTLLVWVPALASGHADAYQKREFVLSCALTAAGWVVADSYRGTRWLAVALPGLVRPPVHSGNSG